MFKVVDCPVNLKTVSVGVKLIPLTFWNVKLKLELSVAMLTPSVALNVRANVPAVAPLSDDKGRTVKTDESWLITYFPMPLPSESTLYVKLEPGVSESMATTVTVDVVVPSLANVIVPDGSIEIVGDNVTSALLYQPDPSEI